MGRGLASRLHVSNFLGCNLFSRGGRQAQGLGAEPRTGDQEIKSLGPSAVHPHSSAAPSSARTTGTRTDSWRRVWTRVGRGGRWRPRPLEGLARRASVFRCGVGLLPGRAGWRSGGLRAGQASHAPEQWDL